MTAAYLYALLLAVPVETVAFLAVMATDADLRPHHHPHRHRRTRR